ncbi:hypothetical protein KI387_016315, partial [Taxus chinensis]
EIKISHKFNICKINFLSKIIVSWNLRKEKHVDSICKLEKLYTLVQDAINKFLLEDHASKV